MLQLYYKYSTIQYKYSTLVRIIQHVNVSADTDYKYKTIIMLELLFSFVFEQWVVFQLAPNRRWQFATDKLAYDGPLIKWINDRLSSLPVESSPQTCSQRLACSGCSTDQ